MNEVSVHFKLLKKAQTVFIKFAVDEKHYYLQVVYEGFDSEPDGDHGDSITLHKMDKTYTFSEYALDPRYYLLEDARDIWKEAREFGFEGAGLTSI